jgi:hypothetical protein
MRKPRHRRSEEDGDRERDEGGFYDLADIHQFTSGDRWL